MSAIGEKTKIFLVVASYFVISISMVFLNKALMESSGGKSIPAPLFVTWFQCVVTAIICWFLGVMGGDSKNGFLKQFPKQSYDLKTAIRVMPLSLIFVGMITFNNYCLKLVAVSFYQVARSLTIVFNVLFTLFILHTKTSLRVLACCAIVISGFFIGSSGEIDFSLVGTIFGVLSSVFVSLNSIFTKKIIARVDNNSWKLCYYNNMNAIFLFIPCILVFEMKTIQEYLPVFSSFKFWTNMNLAGVLGFMIGIVTILQISVTSPLTHNISGTAKACVQTIIAVFNGSIMTARSWFGTSLVLVGTFLYSYVRNKEMDMAKKMEARKIPELSPKEPTDTDIENKPLIVKDPMK